MAKKIINKIVLTEAEQRKVDLLTEEFNARGGKMTTEEIISRWGAIPFEDFSKENN